jgi:hypothetical protein
MMRKSAPRVLLVLALLAVGTTGTGAQAPAADKKPRTPRDPAVFDTTPRRLFRDKSGLLEVTITTNLRQFVRTRDRGRPSIPATLAWSVGGDTGTARIQIATRGNFRLKGRNCSFPPVRLLFEKDSAKKTLWAGQRRLKLVTRCDEGREYEQYILQEYALYEVYNQLTPYSFRARLVRVGYRDVLGKEKPVDTYAFLIEDDGDLADRVGGKVTDAKNATFDDVDLPTMATLSFFEYLIGNTDWSLGGLHNIKLFMTERDANVYPVAYDFDFSGAVGTRYATPDPRLRIKQVTDRLYRGRCLTDEQAAAVVATFNQRKAAIYAVYDRIPGLDQETVAQTREYFDGFYRTINDPRALKRNILDDCQKIGN